MPQDFSGMIFVDYSPLPSDKVFEMEEGGAIERIVF
jgi:hypothetical protein